MQERQEMQEMQESENFERCFSRPMFLVTFSAR